MKVEVRSSFAGLEQPWEQLRRSSAADHLFSSFIWQQAWWDVFGEGRDLHLVLLWDGDDLAAIAPLYRDGQTLQLVGGADVTDYLDFLYRAEAAPRLISTLGDLLAESGRTQLDLCCIPDDSPTIPLIQNLGKQLGYGLTIAENDVCPAVDLPGDWEAYLAGLSKKDRHELRRKLRRLETGHQVRHDQARDLPAIRAAWPDFFRLQALSRAEKAEFQTDRMKVFFERLAEDLYPVGWFQLHFLEVDGERVSSVICFDQADELWLYNSGYDPEYRHLSVGLLLKALCLRRAIEQGKRRFDFLRGREPYKYDLGAVDRPIYRLQLARG